MELICSSFHFISSFFFGYTAVPVLNSIWRFAIVLCVYMWGTFVKHWHIIYAFFFYVFVIYFNVIIFNNKKFPLSAIWREIEIKKHDLASKLSSTNCRYLTKIDHRQQQKKEKKTDNSLKTDRKKNECNQYLLWLRNI